MNTDQKFALVTGASSGIGWHISFELAKKGYSILAVSNQETQLEELKKELQSKYPVKVLPYYMDLSNTSAPLELFEYCELQNLEIEILINNAGMLIYGDIVNTEYTKVEKIIQLHMNTPTLLCRLFGEKMKLKGNGYILNVSSISAIMPYPIISLYGPSKTFIRNFTRALGTELRYYNVKVSCLMPGATATGLYEIHKDNISLAMKLGIMKKPEWVAKIGVKALFSGKVEVIPGFINKLTVIILPLIPDWVIRSIYKKFIFNKKKFK